LEAGEQFQSFVEEKIGSLKKYVDVLKREEEKNTLAEVFVDVEKETKHHVKGNVFKAEAKILFPGKKIIAKAMGDDLLLAIVKLKDKLQQEIKKYKLKPMEARRRLQRKSKEEIL
jgi:ribosomal subunit interface protein